jgi:hypothetical protein
LRTPGDHAILHTLLRIPAHAKGHLEEAVDAGLPYPDDAPIPNNWDAVKLLTTRLAAADVRTILVSSANPDPRGMIIHGQVIDGPLELDGLQGKIGLRLAGCLIASPISLIDAGLPWLELTGCVLRGALIADRAQLGWLSVSDCLFEFRRDGAVLALAQAKVAHDVRLAGSKFALPQSDRNPGDWAVDLAGAAISGQLSLADLESTEHRGGIRLTGANISGAIDARGATITGLAAQALLADYLTVGGDAFMCQEGAQLTATGAGPGGAISLVGATITGRVGLTGAVLEGGSGPALLAAQTTLKDGAMLDRGFRATSRSVRAAVIDLRGAAVTGPLSLEGATVNNLSPALDTDEPATTTSTAVGTALCLSSTTISGRLAVRGATITSDHGAAVMADYMTVNSDAFICEDDKSNFTATGRGDLGAVCLIGATINGQLSLRGTTLRNEDARGRGYGPALVADLLTVKGATRLDRGFIADGAVELWGATLGGKLVIEPERIATERSPAASLDIVAGHLGHGSTAAVWLTGATIGDRLSLRWSATALSSAHGPLVAADGIVVNGDAVISWCSETVARPAAVSLQRASITKRLVLVDAQPSPRLDNDLTRVRRGHTNDASLDLDGLTFTGMPVLKPSAADSDDLNAAAPVMQWLAVLARARYAPQPYHALSAAYEGIGDDSTARTLLISQHDDALIRGNVGGGRRLYETLSKWFVGYGYRSLRAIWWVVGVFVVTFAFSAAVLRPAKDIAVPPPSTQSAAPAAPKKCSLAGTADYAVSLAFPLITLSANDPPCDVNTTHTNFLVVLFSWLVRLFTVTLVGFFAAGLAGLTNRSPSGG